MSFRSTDRQFAAPMKDPLAHLSPKTVPVEEPKPPKPPRVREIKEPPPPPYFPPVVEPAAPEVVVEPEPEPPEVVESPKSPRREPKYKKKRGPKYAKKLPDFNPEPMTRQRASKKTPFLDTNSTATTAILERTLLSRTSPVDVREIAIEFFKQIGGSEGFVAKILADYEVARIGSPERARLLEIALKLFQAATPKDVVDPNQMTDAELEQQAKGLMKQMGLHEQSWVDHVCI